jgi:hypothetical protein
VAWDGQQILTILITEPYQNITTFINHAAVTCCSIKVTACDAHISMRRFYNCVRAELSRPGAVKLSTIHPRHSSTASPLAINTLLNADGPSLENTRQSVQGFVRSVRKQKNVAFAAVSDGSTLEALQVVLTPSQAQEYV